MIRVIGGDRIKPSSRVLNLKFVPLEAVAKQCDDPAGGTEGQHKDGFFTHDEETRNVVRQDATPPYAVAVLPDGYDAVQVDTQEPAVNICTWVIGRAEDCDELRQAVAAFVAAKDRLLELIGSGDED